MRARTRCARHNEEGGFGLWAVSPNAAKLPTAYADEVEREARHAVPEEVCRAMLGVPTPALSHEECLNRDYDRGRFASRCQDDFIYNWEDRPLPESR